ncbi:hypothetical protein TNCV_3604291 [Trichonephila clavipes]|nr:hypothetical protein TNCV_3604291 [Trichonephila clavipes]
MGTPTARNVAPAFSEYAETVRSNHCIWLDSAAILSQNNLGRGLGASHLSSPSSNYSKGLLARRIFRELPCRKCMIRLQTSMPSPGFEPNGIVFCVTNHYTGWVANTSGFSG